MSPTSLIELIDEGFSGDELKAMATGIQGFKDVQGPTLIGMVISYILLGCITTQLIAYRQGYWEKDSWRMKSFILVLYATIVTRGALDMTTLYTTLISSFGTLGASIVPNSFVGNLIVGCIPLALCQIWLVHRVWMVSQKKGVAPAIFGLLLALASTGLQITYTAFRIHHREVRSPSTKGDVFLRAWAFTAAATDIYLCAGFVYYAVKQKQTAMSARLDHLLKSLMRLSLQSCLPTASLALAMAIAQILEPHKGWFIMFSLLLPHSYIISVLYTLNARDRVAKKADTASGAGEGASHFRSSYLSPALDSGTEKIPSRSRFDSWTPSFGSFGRRDSRRDSVDVKDGISCTVETLRRLEPLSESPVLDKDEKEKEKSPQQTVAIPLVIGSRQWNSWEGPGEV